MASNISAQIKPLQLIAPQAASATVTGTGVQFTPGEIADAVAIANIGATTGAPTSFTVIVTIEQSATQGGTYTVSQTFSTATGVNQIGSAQVLLDITKPWVRAKATIAFVGGASPTIVVGVILGVGQRTNSDSNMAVLA